MQADALTGGFDNAPTAAALAFRALLEAMARPGVAQDIAGAMPPAPLSPAAGALVLTLADRTTPVHLAASHDLPALRDWITFHCGAPLVGAAQAVLAVGTWAALQPVARFARGTPEYPDRAATLVIETAGVAQVPVRLRGPGIRGEILAELPEVAGFAANAAGFPLGWDAFLTGGGRVSALPRSTKVDAV
jgi:alpha-D-ribose 1-methylphosphonate 5-triphosphate synthase subunit PhnH